MNLNNYKRKLVCTVLIFTILLQSCEVYKNKPSTLDDAVAAKTKVLIIRSNDSKLHLRRVIKINGVYYGQKYINTNLENVPLTNLDIKTIKILNKSTTTWGNIGIAFGSILIIGTIIVAASLNNTPDTISLEF